MLLVILLLALGAFCHSEMVSSQLRMNRARLRLAEAQGIIPIGSSEDYNNAGFDVNNLKTMPIVSSKVREISWRVAEPAVKYDPVLLYRKFFTQPVRWVARNIQIFVPLALFTCSVIYDILLNQEESMRKQRSEELLVIISAQSPAIIKAGQAMSSRSDLLPKEYLNSLQKLQDRCPPFPTDSALKLFEEELGKRLEDVIVLEQYEPIAAASIGQVYKGTLRSNGAKVAIKIQRPNCEESIAIDLFVLRWYAALIQNVFQSVFKRDINLVSVIDDFGELIYREIDYRAEAVNAQRFAELYANIKDVFVPKVYTDLSTSKVLTMEWVDGARLDSKEDMLAMGLDNSKYVDILVECSLRQIVEVGFFHADPHLGNLFALPSGKLCYLDFGMVSYVEASQRYSIIEAVVHLVNRDFQGLAELYKRMGFIPMEVDSAPIVKALELALPDVLNAAVEELNFKNVIAKLGDVMYKFPFSLPPFYIAIIRCLGVLEGVALQVDKNFRIINKAYPYISSRLLTDTSTELKSALQQLIFRDGKPRWDRLQDLLEVASTTKDYDIVATVDQLLTFLLSPQADSIRETLAQQLLESVDEIDLTSTSNFDFRSIKLPTFVQMETLVTDTRERGLRMVLENLIESQSDDLPSQISAFAKVLKILASQDINTDKLSLLIRKILREPTAQEFFGKLISQLSEKIAGKTVKLLLSPAK